MVPCAWALHAMQWLAAHPRGRGWFGCGRSRACDVVDWVVRRRL